MIKVAQDIIADKAAKKGFRKISYKDVYFDPEGWAEANKFMPADCDLVTIRSKEREIPAWAIGSSWDGYRVKDSEVITHWKITE